MQVIITLIIYTINDTDNNNNNNKGVNNNNNIITADVTNITISTMSLLLLHSKIMLTLLKLPLSKMRYYKDYI